MEVIFFRHGKAEPASDAQSDIARELTSLGRKKLKQAARGLASCLFPEDKILIWTSPAVRSRQTADILKEAFGKRAGIRVVDAVAADTLAELKSEWSALPDETILFIVGHEPMLSDWVKSLSGAYLPFRPASAACLCFDGHVGQLEWFMRVGVMSRLGLAPVSKRRQRA